MSSGAPVPTVRNLAAADAEQWVAAMSQGFLAAPVVPGEAAYRLADMDLTRTWAAYDGERVVGTLRSSPTPLTLPGPAETTAAGLTNVTVAPTHHRRGLLRQMITADLRASEARGEAVGILIASEYPIYGRYGYGPAVEGARYQIDVTGSRFVDPGAGSVELVTSTDLRALAPGLYEQVRTSQPGAIGRSAPWWDRTLQTVAVPHAKPWAGYQAVYRATGGEPEGYVRYSASQEWDQMRPASTLQVHELVATSPAAYHRLWRFCCEVDLVRTVEAGDRHVAETLPLLLVDGRSVRQTARFDFVWLRVLRTADALGARRYLCDGEVVLEVLDDMGLAAGRFVLRGGPEGAECAPTGRAAELTLPVGALGSAYLGGWTLRTLQRAGLVDEHRAGALATADAMFRSPVTPWCATWF